MLFIFAVIYLIEGGQSDVNKGGGVVDSLLPRKNGQFCTNNPDPTSINLQTFKSGIHHILYGDSLALKDEHSLLLKDSVWKSKATLFQVEQYFTNERPNNCGHGCHYLMVYECF